MSEIFYARIFFKSKLNSNPIFFYLFIIILLIQIKSAFFIVDNSCKYNKSFLNTTCFNDKIEFHENFIFGKFETFKDGTLIIEYSQLSRSYNIYNKRLFYGLKKNGRYYFPDESPFKYLDAYNPLNNQPASRYGSKNKIIYLSGDTNKEKEYLFSTSNSQSVTELHDLEGNISNYWDSPSFWEINGMNGIITSYEIILLDLPENDENHYLCIFNQAEYVGLLSDTFSIRKFGFNSFVNYTIIKKEDYTDIYRDSPLISALAVYDCQIIVIFF